MRASVTRRIQRAGAVIGLALLAIVGIGAPAQAATSEQAVERTGTWFGPELDWAEDSPRGYADRLGETPATYALRLAYPLDDAEVLQAAE